MTAPTTQLTVTQRYALKDLVKESGMVPAGRIMLWKGTRSPASATSTC